MKFKLFNAPTDEPIYIITEEIICFHSVKNSVNEETIIKLRGGHSITVKQTVEELKKILKINDNPSKPAIAWS